jgi:hypothetical protein
MGNVPARCSRCGNVFFTRIQANKVSGLTFQGIGYQCPRCGGMADVVEGTFDVSGGTTPTFTQTAGKPVDREIFSRLGLVLIQAKLDNLSPHEIVEKVAPHSSALARRLRAVADDPTAFATVLAAVIGTFGAIAVAMIATGGKEPSKEEIHIHIEQPSSSDLERYRDGLHQFRKSDYSPPRWSADYIEPDKS